MNTIATQSSREQLDNPYAAPQTELHSVPMSSVFPREPIAWRSTIFLNSLKVGFYSGYLFCLLVSIAVIADIVDDFDLTRALDNLWLLFLYWISILLVLPILGGCVGAIIMALDLLLQIVGVSEPPPREQNNRRINLRPRSLLIDWVRK